MRYILPALITASPALAHPASAPNTHGPDWALPLGVAVILLGAIVAIRQARRAKP